MEVWVTSLLAGLGTFLSQGGQVLWLILGLSLVLWLMLFGCRRKLSAAEDAWRIATATPTIAWMQTTVKGRARLMESALIRVEQTVAADLHWAKVLVAIMPLLGLLGTVAGMIECFETLSAQAQNDHQTLTGGISAALLTTLAGLVCALPGLVAVHRIERRASHLVDQVRARLRRFMRPGRCALPGLKSQTNKDTQNEI